MSGFKSINQLKGRLKLRPRNVSIGANGAGKSNLFSFLCLLTGMPAGKLRESAGRVIGSSEHPNRLKAASYRIKAVVREFQKAVDIVVTITRSGLPKLRQRCLHFAQWTDSLESVVAG